MLSFLSPTKLSQLFRAGSEVPVVCHGKVWSLMLHPQQLDVFDDARYTTFPLSPRRSAIALRSITQDSYQVLYDDTTLDLVLLDKKIDRFPLRDPNQLPLSDWNVRPYHSQISDLIELWVLGR